MAIEFSPPYPAYLSSHRPPPSLLHWSNVATASLLLILNGFLSIMLGLGVERDLLVASLRCVVQLSVLGLLLEDVFKFQGHLPILILATCLVLFGAFEVTFRRTKHRFQGMIASVFFSLLISTMISVGFGNYIAMDIKPFWIPAKFITTFGLLLGNCMSGVAVGVNTCLVQLTEQRDLIEQKLALGATRWEACKPVATSAVKLALLPTINSMSVMGLISIPGMITGQLVSGASVFQAALHQQIVMFMISSCTCLGTIISVLGCIFTCLDGKHQLRLDRITNYQWDDQAKHAILAQERRERKSSTTKHAK